MNSVMKAYLILNFSMTGKVNLTVRYKHTESNCARLCFVKLDHLGVFGAYLNLFVELQNKKIKCNGQKMEGVLLDGEHQGHVMPLY